MINNILLIVKMLIAVLPFVALCFLSRRVNLEKTQRSKQFAMPVIAVIYVIIAMLLMDSINTWLLQLIDNIPGWIAALAGVPWMPENIGSIFNQISSFVSDILHQINLNFWIFFISNIVIISVYLLLKKICIGIIKKRVKTDGNCHRKIAEFFYEYFSEKDKWCLRENCVQTRSLLKVFYYSAVILSVILMLVSRQFYYDGIFKSVFYPVFGILVVGELFFYLDAITKCEYIQDILGEDEDAYKTVNYSLLRKFLRSLFKDKLLTENTSVNNSLAYDVTNDEIIRTLEMSEDQKVVSFAGFFRSLNSAGFEIDHNYLNSSLDMLNGKSIIFSNPFYYDLIPYAFYPMNRILLSHKKVLVVLGRHAIESNIQKWLVKGIESVTNIPFLWNIGVLNCEEQDLDIGIITRSDVLNTKLHNANSKFLSEVGFFVVIEPSKLISTAQIGLNLIAKKCCGDNDRQIVYCLCDKNCDGLVDAMSHILMTSLTEVSATKKHLGTSSYMCWEADDEYLHHRLLPNISRYLGIGTELSFAALKNQVSCARWYGGEAFPVTDIGWIDKQYYYDLMKYAGLPTSQDAMDEHFEAVSDFWSAQLEKNNYITVEDESFNMFEILRDFSTRATEQGFVNVISSEYLLKDYMANNASVFETDAKAIPFVVPDYARSNRNVVLKLILMMSTYGVSDNALKKELSLIGIKVFDLQKQLWFEIFNCYAGTADLLSLSGDYATDVESVSNMNIHIADADFSICLIKAEQKFNIKSGEVEDIYSIDDYAFLSKCVNELKSAGYVAEDEKGEKYYLGSELGGHIYQKYLPGQFFTFAGKYYEMQYLTAEGQILVRRAADHINGRPTYRQIRTYTISGIKSSGKIGAQKNISGLKVTKEYADFSVSTAGYYKMSRYNDFATARKILFEGDKNGVPVRVYHNKEILRIELPELDGKMNDNIRYTITVLFNEVFRTVFAENQPYICAVTDLSFVTDDNTVKPLTYSLAGDGCELSSNSIYIIEDSQLDMGLTVAVERYLDRIFKIVYDYLDWHIEMLEKSINPPADPELPIVFGGADEPETSSNSDKKGFFRRITEKVRKVFSNVKEWFRRKRNKEQELPEDSNNEMQEELTGRAEADGKPEYVFEPEKTKTVSGSINGDSAEESMFRRKPYHERYFTLFGGNEEPSVIDLAGTLSYLSEMKFDKNSLKQARDGKKTAEFIEATYKPNKADSRYCDFCGCEIYGVEYETLSDGRDRCIACGRTAIKTAEEFRRIFEDVKRNMESFFGIKINVGVRVEMVNSRSLHKRLGQTFIPTPKSDPRILGVAVNDKNGYSLYIENGAPRMASMLTMVHELTHIWQYINWDDKAIVQKYGKKMRLEIYEGMAKWVEIQYAYLINEQTTAKREEIITSYRDDEYGRGFLRYHANYPFSTGTVMTKPTPFGNTDYPLNPDYCGSITFVIPHDDNTEVKST